MLYILELAFYCPSFAFENCHFRVPRGPPSSPASSRTRVVAALSTASVFNSAGGNGVRVNLDRDVGACGDGSGGGSGGGNCAKGRYGGACDDADGDPEPHTLDGNGTGGDGSDGGKKKFVRRRGRSRFTRGGSGLLHCFSPETERASNSSILNAILSL
jgi:hypothetical protein